MKIALNYYDEVRGNMINSSNISIIIQGHISEQYTPKCLASIRHLLPQAEIIVSTTDEICEVDLDCDIFVQSPDPGAELIDRKNKVYNNINRQIVSTKAGLARATRPFSLKFRTDIALDGIEWLDYFGKYDEICPATFFKNRVLICDYYTRNPRIVPVPFHPSDWIMFGLTEDLKQYYDLELQDKDEILWFDRFPKTNSIFSHMRSRYTPEQYLCIQYLKRFKNLEIQNYYDASKQNIEETERFFAENMVILDYGKQLEITFQKYHPNRYKEAYSLLHHKDWITLFNHYCKKRRILFWTFYRCKCKMTHIIFMGVRKHVVELLNVLHLKEPLKRILRGRS